MVDEIKEQLLEIKSKVKIIELSIRLNKIKKVGDEIV